MLVAECEPGPASAASAGAPDAMAAAIALLRAAGGDVERLRSNAVVAGFHDPRAGVAAANRLHADAASAPDHPPRRIGIHVGEVIMTDDASAARTAIERAATLAAIARPGTTAVAAGALAAIGSLRDATIETLPVSADRPDTAVALIIPHAPRSPSLDRRRLVAALAGAAVVGAGAAWFGRRSFWAPDERRHVTLGVGPFDASNIDPAHAWIGPALRTGLNTQLSQLSGVKVYSHAFLDFHVSRERVPMIEIASRLGIEKMLSGSVLIVGDSVRVEVQVMDVATGLLEGAHASVGRAEDFLALENEMVLAVVAALPLRLTPEDESRLAARRTLDPESFRRFLGTEGAGETPAGAPPPGEGGPRPPSSFLPWPRMAYADDAGAEVATLLEAYRRALESHDTAALEAMYLTFQPAQRAMLEGYFKSVRDLKVRLEDVDVSIIGEEAAVSYTRIDDSVDVETRRPQHLSVRVTRMLRLVDGRWRFASAQ